MRALERGLSLGLRVSWWIVRDVALLLRVVRTWPRRFRPW